MNNKTSDKKRTYRIDLDFEKCKNGFNLTSESLNKIVGKRVPRKAKKAYKMAFFGIRLTGLKWDEKKTWIRFVKKHCIKTKVLPASISARILERNSIGKMDMFGNLIDTHNVSKGFRSHLK